MSFRTLAGVCIAVLFATSSANAQVALGNFDPVEESGWGHWNGGFVSGVAGPNTQLSTEEFTTGTTSAQITLDGFGNTLAFNADLATREIIANNTLLEFDAIFKTDDTSAGGFQSIAKINLNFGTGFQEIPSSSFQQGWGSTQPGAITQSIAVDYSSFGFDPANLPGFLQIIFATNNGVSTTTNESIFIDNVRVSGADPFAPILDIDGNEATSFIFGNWGSNNTPLQSVFDITGETIIINDSVPAGQNGGVGYQFGGNEVDFNPLTHELQIEAKLLGNNAADEFRIILSDEDGDDSGPGLGSEDYVYRIDTSNFNSTDFSTLTIPLGTGTEDGSQPSNINGGPSINEGDGIQNFDLFRLGVQSLAEDPDMNPMGTLNIEIAGIRIVPRMSTELDGDFNNDGVVNAADYTIWRDNVGGDEESLNGNGDGSGTIDAGDYSLWVTQFGQSNPSSSAAESVPEPTSLTMLLALLCGVSLTKRSNQAAVK